ncbi:divalent metal cation (Fe/Co/Zn/Cd) transporter [Lysinibacillus composti]|nr:tripartite tricarboxylate transporter TctB family protein [Lysinibacillus composti]MBM7607429.1 divalent metal cation (Fe/Co/Zn/Cd) transporter [Lysinibacillus composti]
MKNISIYISLVLLIFSGVMLFDSFKLEYGGDYGPGAGFLPVWVNGILFILTFILFIMSFKKDIRLIKDVLPQHKERLHLLITILSPILFLTTLNFLGFTLSSILVLFCLFVLSFKWYWSATFAFIVSIVIFFVFKELLSVPLPVNQFGW